MKFRWKEATAPERAEWLKSIYKPDMTTAQMAALSDGATRGAIIGFFQRQKNKLMKGYELLPSGNQHTSEALTRRGLSAEGRKVLPPNVQAARRGEKNKKNDKACFEPPVVEGLKTRDVPLMLVGRYECRWVTVDEGYLMCGLPVQDNSSYCPCHRAIVYESAE